MPNLNIKSHGISQPAHQSAWDAHLRGHLRDLVVGEAAARAALHVAAQPVAAHDDPAVPVCTHIIVSTVSASAGRLLASNTPSIDLQHIQVGSASNRTEICTFQFLDGNVRLRCQPEARGVTVAARRHALKLRAALHSAKMCVGTATVCGVYIASKTSCGQQGTDSFGVLG